MKKGDLSVHSGFTIVELLVVIVIIGVLAAIVIVSYTGITERAFTTSLKSDLAAASQQLKMYQIEKNVYPTSLGGDDCFIPAGDNGCLKASSGNHYDYVASNVTAPQTFCITATHELKKYHTTQEGILSAGMCPTLNLDAYLSSSYPGVGTVWTDFSGNGSNGILTNGPVYDSSGVVFDGIDDFILVHNTPSLNNLTTSLSIEAWVYPTKFDGYWRRIISRDSWSNQNWFIEFNGDNPGKIEYNGGTSNSTLSLDTWYCVAVVLDGSNVSLYINGQLDRTSGYTELSTSSADIGIGGDPDGEDNGSFEGKISSVSVYDSVMTASDIEQNFNDLRDRYGI